MEENQIQNNKIVVLMKTHIWNESIENFALKIYNETINYNIDFFVLMHDENDTIYELIQSDFIKKVTLTFKEDDIKKIYPIGFFTMWISNHWILMWFFLKYREIYNFYWSVEYDVRISGIVIKYGIILLN